MTLKTPLQELFACAAENVVNIFNESGEVLPMWHIVGPDDQHQLIATPWENPEAKAEMAIHLRTLFKAVGVKRYVFVCEAWTLSSSADPNIMAHIGRIHKHQDRREVVTVQAEDKNGESVSGVFYILRPEHGKPTLSPLEMNQYDATGGQLQGMLR